MGIFGEQAWAMYETINEKNNGLTAYYSSESSWHIVITRENCCLDGVPFEIKKQITKNSWSHTTPAERIWSPHKKDFPFYAIYVVPWSSYDDGDGTHGMIKMINNKKDKYMTRMRRLGSNSIKIHGFLSEFQYPFLKDIRSMTDVFYFLHKTRTRRLGLEREIIKGAFHPKRLEHYLSLGYSVDDVCDN